MIEALRLTPLGTIHTAIALVAVLAGIIALVRHQEIAFRSVSGKTYVILTVLTCITGFGIFEHGGFGKPHVLGIATLVVLIIAAVAEYSTLFGRASRYVATIGYSTTFFFHFIPAIAETTTRLPVGAPLFPDAEAPGVLAITGVLFVVFLVGIALQVRHLRARQRDGEPLRRAFDAA